VRVGDKGPSAGLVALPTENAWWLPGGAAVLAALMRRRDRRPMTEVQTKEIGTAHA
jgi:hypothetical protein